MPQVTPYILISKELARPLLHNHATKLEWYVVNHSQSPPPHTQDITHNSRHVLGSVTKQRVVIPRCSTNELETHSPIPPHQQLRYSSLGAHTVAEISIGDEQQISIHRSGKVSNTNQSQSGKLLTIARAERPLERVV